MRFLLLLLAMAVMPYAYTQTSGTRFETKVPLPEVDQILLPALDNDVLKQEELQHRMDNPDAAPRFAEGREVNVNPTTHGTWENLPGDLSRWRLRIISEGAYSVNLGFSQYVMPKGGSFILYAPGQKKPFGPFTTHDNEDHEQFWSPVIAGQEVVLEIEIPTAKKNELRLQLQYVNHDFMNFFEQNSGACHLDVVCGAEDGHPIVEKYKDAIQSVAVYSFGGQFICTGFLVNNSQGDCTPYFMTANHCGVNAQNAPSMVVYWNYENSTCREPRSPAGAGIGDGQLNDFNTGATFRANYALSDFTLVELEDTVSATANAFFAGWDATNETPTDTVAIVHHPGTEEKRISFSFTGAFTGAWGSATTPIPNGDALIISNWDIGSTENGSSGAPLFDKNNRVLGQLRGGSASCNISGFDAFGWFNKSWTGGGAPSNSLQPWLDPANTNTLILDGKAQATCGITLIATSPFQQVCAPTQAVFEIDVSEIFTDLVQLTLNGLPENTNITFSQNPVMPGNKTTITITTNGLPSGEYNLTLNGTDGLQATDIILGLQVSSMATPAINFSAPADNATNVSLFPTFSWDGSVEAQSYQIQVATDINFSNIISDITDITADSINKIKLAAVTEYFWRVRGNNNCGEGTWSTPRSFTTADITCATVSPNDLPQDIFDLLPNVTTSATTLDLPGAIVDIRINNLNIAHSWIGDIQVALTSPQGSSVRLFDRPGVPADDFGCDGKDVVLNFNDNAAGTAEQLESTCGDSPAISGDFRPLDPFALLFGENASGEWRLTVEDFVPEDGGAINAWSLEVCTAQPKDVSIKSSSDRYAICADETVTFDIILGRDFNKNNGITLAASGNPEGSTVSFSSNPANPGDTVQVTISNIAGQNISTVVIEATDGNEVSNIELELIVSDTPNDYDLLFPSMDATNIPLSTSLEWSLSQTADRYIIMVESESGTQIALDTVNIALYFVSNLDFGTTYNWSVQAINSCGLGDAKTFSFTTIPDINFSVSPVNINACKTDQPSFNLRVGPGFGENTMVTYSISPEQNIPINFSADANNIPVGTTIKATLNELGSVPVGEYEITFQVTDGTYTNEDLVTIFLRGVPSVPNLLEPVDGATTNSQLPTLVWQNITDATRYRVEIARDDTFSDMITTVEVTDTLFALEDMLGGGLHYWRITALNDCGFSTSRTFDFFVQAAGIQQWQGQQVSFQPNPTSGMLTVQFAQALSGNLMVEIYNTNGQLLQRQAMQQATTELSFDLSGHASGMYFIRLVHGNALLTQRILLQK